MPGRCAHPDCQKWPFQDGLCRDHEGYVPEQEGADPGVSASAYSPVSLAAPGGGADSAGGRSPRGGRKAPASPRPGGRSPRPGAREGGRSPRPGARAAGGAGGRSPRPVKKPGNKASGELTRLLGGAGNGFGFGEGEEQNNAYFRIDDSMFADGSFDQAQHASFEPTMADGTLARIVAALLGLLLYPPFPPELCVEPWLPLLGRGVDQAREL